MPASTSQSMCPDTSEKITPTRNGPRVQIATRVWRRPIGVGHMGRFLPYASCFVLRIWLIALDALPASDSCKPRRDANERYFRFSALAQSPTKRRASYLSPAIVSAFGTTVLEISPIVQRRESGLSSGGTPQFVLSR